MTHCSNKDPHDVHGMCCLQAAAFEHCHLYYSNQARLWRLVFYTEKVQFHCKNLSESISSVAGRTGGLFPQATLPLLLLLIDFFPQISTATMTISALDCRLQKTAPPMFSSKAQLGPRVVHRAHFAVYKQTQHHIACLHLQLQLRAFKQSLYEMSGKGLLYLVLSFLDGRM